MNRIELLGKLRTKNEKCAFIIFQVLFLPFLITKEFSRLWNCRSIWDLDLLKGPDFVSAGSGYSSAVTYTGGRRPAGRQACLSGAGDWFSLLSK